MEYDDLTIYDAVIRKIDELINEGKTIIENEMSYEIGAIRASTEVTIFGLTVIDDLYYSEKVFDYLRERRKEQIDTILKQYLGLP